jgi:hypothetical protein
VAAVIGAGTYWTVDRAARKHVTSSSVPGPVHLAFITVKQGDIHIVNHVGPARVRSTAHFLFSKPRIESSIKNGILTVRATCAKSWLADCSTDIRLSVPPKTTIDAETTDGDITADALTSSRIRAETTRGRVRLDLANDPTLIVAHSHRGDVTIHLPRATYVVDATAELGQTHIGIPHDGRAPRTIEATANHGEVRIAVESEMSRP